MADDKSSGGWGSGIVVLVFAAVSALYVTHQKPEPVSTRPSDSGYLTHNLDARQNIDARLWQDPFDAVRREIESREPPRVGVLPHSPSEAVKVAGSDTLILAITLPGAPYPEIAETRRRLRYAVLSALHLAGYMPAEEEHIGYWRPQRGNSTATSPQVTELRSDDWPRAVAIAEFRDGLKDGSKIRAQPAIAQPADQPIVPSVVPWEAFNGDSRELGNTSTQIIVLWLDQDVLTDGRHPIASIAELRRQLNVELSITTKFAVLGPEDSATLLAMAREPRAPSRCDLDRAGQRQGSFAVYNFGATADPAAVLQHVGNGCADLTSQLARAGIREYYTIVNSDADLAKSLVCELGRRGIRIYLQKSQCSGLRSVTSSRRDHIVLISDWDAVYGEYLATSFAKALTGGADRAEWLTRVSYLRGLDGQLPGDQATGSPQTPNAAQKSKDTSVATPDTVGEFESARGQSQVDYLDRLASDLKKRETEFVRQGQGHISAIGVLGSDVYDKRLILQELRPAFPNAQFFTTDFDALLMPQNKKRYTSGLLIASSFGLQLGRRLQGDIPPFRNTYQTSIFLAARMAIERELSEGSSAPNVSATDEFQNLAASRCWTPPPAVFQIGRDYEQPLPLQSVNQPCLGTHIRTADGISGTLATLAPNPGKLYPELPAGAYRSVSILCAGLLLIVAFSFRTFRQQCVPSATPRYSGAVAPGKVAQGSPELPDATNPATPTSVSTVPECPPLYWLMAATALIALGVSFAFWAAWPTIADWMTENGNGEPMVLFEGISLWPTILLRAFGAGLTFWLICYTRSSLGKNRTAYQSELGLDEPTQTATGKGQMAQTPTAIEEWRAIYSNSREYPTLIRKIVAMLWVGPIAPSRGGRPPVSFDQLVGGFAIRWPARCIRAGLGTLGMFGIWRILVPIFGEPHIAARGERVLQIYHYVTRAEVLLTLFLIFIVADAALFSRAFITKLTDIHTRWPSNTIKKFQRKLNLDETDLADWIDMHFIAARTRCVTNLIYLPFIALAILMVSRSPLFDNFTTSWMLVITQTLSVALVIWSAVALRLAAERARTVARDSLTAAVIAASGYANARDRSAQLEKLLEQVEGLDDGAFAPWSSQPTVRAVLLPLVTYGGTMLVHLYALPGT